MTTLQLQCYQHAEVEWSVLICKDQFGNWWAWYPLEEKLEQITYKVEEYDMMLVNGEMIPANL